MNLAERLAQERRARLAAERLLELKQAELSAANRRLGQHAQALTQRVAETQAETARVRIDLSDAHHKADIAEKRLLSSVKGLRSGFAIFDECSRLVFANDAYLHVFEGLDEVKPGIEFARLVQILTDEGIVNTGDMRPEIWRAMFLENFERPAPKLTTIQLWNEAHVQMAFKRNATGDVVSLAYDVTSAARHAEELTEARHKAEAANRAKSAFLANMSHEIRTPMNGVVGMAELLADTELNQEQRLYIDTIKNSAEALLVIINDVLDYSKIEADRLTLHPEPFDLERCIHEITTILQPSARDKGIDLIVDYDMFLPTTFVGDPGRIRQVLTNILGNAVKFTSSGHVLTRVVGINRDGGDSTVHVTVEDTGIGIAPDMIDHVFGEFNQVEDASNRQFEGTGLGLAISKRLIDLMGGKIWVDSEVDRGSCFGFQVTLPVAGDIDARPPRLPARLRNVLIVDDHPVNRDILERQLSTLGATVRSVDSGQAALGEIDPPPDMILTDHIMPEMSGLELVEKLHDRGVKSPILLLSSNPSYVDGDPARGLLSAVLQKPVARAVLFAELEKLGAQFPGTAPGPARADDAPPSAEIPAHDPTKPTRRMSILAAEDNRTNRLVFEKMTSDLDIDLRFATNGLEAVAAIKEAPPDLVFMDISMPQLDGKAATEEIRKTESATGGHVPIIALTAHAMSGDRDDILKSGLDDYLTKPLRKAEIHRLIAAHVPQGCADPFAPAAAGKLADTG